MVIGLSYRTHRALSLLVEFDGDRYLGVMTRLRKLGFRIALAACALSVSFCVASIFLRGQFGVALLVGGSVMFLPSSVYLASRLSGRPLFDRVDFSPAKDQPVLGSALVLIVGLVNLGEFLSPNRSVAHDGGLHKLEGVMSILLIAIGAIRLLAAIVEQHRMRSQPRP